MLGRLFGWSKTKVTEETVDWEFSLSGKAPTLKLTISHQSRAATFAQIVDAWTNDASFRLAFSTTLENCPFSAFRWELPRLTIALADRPFECAVVDSPSLLVPAEPGAFSAHFTQGKEVVAFPNLGGDAALVVPCPLNFDTKYGHLGAFLRTAPDSQKHLLWQAVGTEMKRRLSAKPVWLNTAGGGVPWLHIRLDDRPKYYRHDPYR